MNIKNILFTLCYFTGIHTNPNKTITLYHQLNSPTELESVQKHGLFSFKKAYEQKLTQASLNRVLKVKLDHRKENDIYFEPTLNPNAEIAFQVSADNLYVYNAAYRKIGDWPAYNNSKIALSIYLQAIENMKKIQDEHPDKKVTLDPNNCQPIIFTIKNPTQAKRRKFESHKITTYDAEVAIHADKIAPENLIFITK